MLIPQHIGSFPAFAASTPVQVALASLQPHHVLVGLEARIGCTSTDASGVAGMTAADLDTYLATVVSRVRIYGPTMGEPVNVSIQNLRSHFIMATRGRDFAAKYTAANTNLVGSTTNDKDALATVISAVVPFFDDAASEDFDWCCPSTDEYREGFMELTYGANGAAAVTGGTLTASAITVQLYAWLLDAHAPFVAPQQLIREQGWAQTPIQMEAGLYLGAFDTRNPIGGSSYNPTVGIEKDGKPIAYNTTFETLGNAWLRHAQLPGGFDLPGRAAPFLFHPSSYNEDDLKPSFSGHVVRIHSTVTGGTISYRVLKPVRQEQGAALASRLGLGRNYTESVREVLGVGPDHWKVATFKPRYILPAGR